MVTTLLDPDWNLIKFWVILGIQRILEEEFWKTCDQDKAETENGGKSQSRD